MVSWNTTVAGSAAGLGACLYLYGFHLILGAVLLGQGAPAREIRKLYCSGLC